MVGSAIKRGLLKKGYTKLLTPSRDQLNLLDSDSVKNWFKENKPEIVIKKMCKASKKYIFIHSALNTEQYDTLISHKKSSENVDSYQNSFNIFFFH